MDVFDLMAERDHEQLVFWSEPESGYRGLIAVHDTTLGPALGGTRFWDYDDERDAVIDVLRLSRGMTYKAAITGLALGGGKSVIIGDHRTPERAAIFRAHGRAVASLGGRYITAEDVGTSPEDMSWIREETEHVVGLEDRSGDPSPVTAYGVYQGIKACALNRYGSDDLQGKRVAVQGCGHVGYFLCKDLHGEGAILTVTDIDPEKVARVVTDFGATAVDPDEIYSIDAEIFAPCALGAVINDDTLRVMRFEIIAGGANNQLARIEAHGAALTERGILYAPDYAINAGGLINVYGELKGWSQERAKETAGGIYSTLLRIFQVAEEQNIPTSEAADHLAEERIMRARKNFEYQP